MNDMKYIRAINSLKKLKVLWVKAIKDVEKPNMQDNKKAA